MSHEQDETADNAIGRASRDTRGESERMATERNELDAAMEVARNITKTPQTGTIVPIGTGAPDTMRATLAEQRANAARAALRLRKAAKEHEEEFRQLIERQRREVADLLGPLQDHLKRLEEGLWTVNLYLGRDEQIVQLAAGAPAPADTPITLRQLVLAMDQECLVAADFGGLDARSVEQFEEWITADPAHLEQVMPEPKGVVVLVPSRQERDYGDTWLNAAMHEANTESHWLIRNGGELYLMKTDLRIGDRLLPKRSEFIDYFYTERRFGSDRERIPLEPGSDAWLRAEQAADQRRRHYMRVMLVLQGLADRTAVFHPLPEGGVSFLDVASQESGKVRIINEIDNVLDTGRLPFRQWQRELCEQLRPGMRVAGVFNSVDWYDANRSGSRYSDHSRVTPKGADAPLTGAIYRIEERRGQNLIIRYKRTDVRWGYDTRGDYTYGPHAYKNRATCTLHPGDPFLLPLDLVTVEELTTYLHARTERHAYLSMIPLVKAAITALTEEAEAEKPFRLLLAGRIAELGDIDVSAALTQVDDLVRWWKLANRWHRPLVGDQQAEAKAVEAICREWQARQSAPAASSRDKEIVEALRDRFPDLICVAQRRDGKYAAYLPAGPEQTIWLTIHLYTATGKADRMREWTMVPGRTLASQRVLWMAPAWTEWDHAASTADHLTGPEQAAILDQLRDSIAPHGTPIAVVYRAKGEYDDGRAFMVLAWRHKPRSINDEKLRDPGERMCTYAVQWRRDPTGTPALTAGYLGGDSFTWNRYTGTGRGTPWRPTDSAYQEDTDWRLVWSDPDQLAAVDRTNASITAYGKARREESYEVHRLRNFLQQTLVNAEEDRLRARFLEDHADAEDLWEEHRETLRITHPDMGWADKLLTWLVHSRVNITGLTVAEAAALYGQPVTIPDGLADLRFPTP